MIYFGTDGIRRKSDFFDEKFLSLFCCAIASLPNCKKIAIARDPRSSGDFIVRTLSGQLVSYGLDVFYLGILPSPALAFCTKKLKCDYGIMVTASHNPPSDNGLKLFMRDGSKADEQTERVLEEYIENPYFLSHSEKGNLFLYDGEALYTEHLLSFFSPNLSGQKILLDCAYGATAHLAPKVFRSLGANVTALHDEYDGERINFLCGATHPERLPDEGFDLCFSFDGDGDRVILKRKGKIYNGDRILLCLGKALQREGKLSNNGVCGTVMTNSGYENFFFKNGINFYRSAVGDREVYRKMTENGLCLGGETAGHIIYFPYLMTGDGLANALFLSHIHSLYSLEELDEGEEYPSRSANLSVRKEEKDHWKEIAGALPSFSGVRTVVRPSGTENVIRFLCEAKTEIDAENALLTILDYVKRSLYACSSHL